MLVKVGRWNRWVKIFFRRRDWFIFNKECIFVCFHIKNSTLVFLYFMAWLIYICISHMQEIQRLECELSASGGGTLTHRHWRKIWDRLHRAHAESSRPSSTTVLAPSSAVDSSTVTARAHAQSWRRRCTVELLVKGRVLSEATKAFSQPHHFERFNYTTAAYCDYCTHVLWGLLKTGRVF